MLGIEHKRIKLNEWKTEYMAGMVIEWRGISDARMNESNGKKGGLSDWHEEKRWPHDGNVITTTENISLRIRKIPGARRQRFRVGENFSVARIGLPDFAQPTRRASKQLGATLYRSQVIRGDGKTRSNKHECTVCKHERTVFLCMPIGY